MKVLVTKLKMLEYELKRLNTKTLDEVTTVGSFIDIIEEYIKKFERLISEREEIQNKK